MKRNLKEKCCFLKCHYRTNSYFSRPESHSVSLSCRERNARNILNKFNSSSLWVKMTKSRNY